jgi:hypothetical protein
MSLSGALLQLRDPRTIFTTLHFFLNLQNGPNKLVLHTLGWKGLQGINTLAYWAHSKVRKESVLNMQNEIKNETWQY